MSTPDLSGLAPAGEDRFEVLGDPVYLLRHGSSLDLLRRSSRLLNSKAAGFARTDINEEIEKYFLRDASIYHVAIERASDGHVVSVLRCIVEHDADAVPLCCRTRVIIDYLFTSKVTRGCGHANTLINWTRQWCRLNQANLYVLALEESSPYFVDRGFVLESSPGVNKRLNVFPDTHLLHDSSNSLPESFVDDVVSDEEDEAEEEEAEKVAGTEIEQFVGDDAALAAAMQSEEQQRAESSGSEDDADSEMDDAEEAEPDDDEAQLQRAIALSKREASRNNRQQRSQMDDADDDLRIALALSKIQK
jgi:hypothetical protein